MAGCRDKISNTLCYGFSCRLSDFEDATGELCCCKMLRRTFELNVRLYEDVMYDTWPGSIFGFEFHFVVHNIMLSS